ncbi:CFA54 protein, partial [Upupa epops]|nr:CFA54 protein [Upupa epops]
ESRAANASNKEINVQWYLPSLAKPSCDTGTQVLMLYAYNTEPVRVSNSEAFSPASVFAGCLWIPLARIVSLRKEFSRLKQQAELLMHSSRSLSSAPESTQFLDPSGSLKRIPSEEPRVSAARVQLDGETETMARRCLSEVRALLSRVPDTSLPFTEMPFAITLQSIATLEDLLDPARGCTVAEGDLYSWLLSLL